VAKPLEIIFENETFVVVNKPAGLLSVPDREGKEISLKKILRDKYGDIFVVHRLDRDTSGVILFAKTEDAQRSLSQAFEQRQVEKYYLGIVKGLLPAKRGSIDEPIMEHPGKKGVMMVHKKGKASLTEYDVEEEFGKFSLVRFLLHTGRTHQIRVHMQSLGNPIVVDELYGDGQPILISSFKKNYHLSIKEEAERPILNRLGLHSWKLAFTDENGNSYNFEAPLPKDMKALLQQLNKVLK
jgi:23S rRNA pseudouridine1911/1915/1917 synthase